MARERGAPAALELFRSGDIDERTYYRALAEAEGLVFVDGPRLPVSDADIQSLAFAGSRDLPLIRLAPDVLGGRVAVAPALDRIGGLRRQLQAAPELRHRLVVVAPKTIRATLAAARTALCRQVETTPAVLLGLAGAAPDDLEQVIADAAHTGRDPLILAIRRGIVEEARLATRLARLYGVATVSEFDALPEVGKPRLGAGVSRIRHARGIATPVTPSSEGIARLARSRTEKRARSPAIVTEKALREARRRRDALPALDDAINRLRNIAPELSAANAFSNKTLVGSVLVGLALCAASVVGGATALGVVNALLAAVLVFLAAIRMAILMSGEGRPETPRLAGVDLPGYAVLVPLYREAESITDLVAALVRFDYPPDKLDIKLIVEADDLETRMALERTVLPPWFDVVVVPAAAPRTKPKALAFALPESRGDLITIYDAEDRPEPDQLRRVAEVFAAGPDDLGCIQARLAVDHAGDTWFTRHFALEYAVLFDWVLPWLSSRRIPFPLGGTSNHMRRAALQSAGDWDPFNVTEDADLGIRLARYGWSLSAIDSDTWEEAPLDLKSWFAQRTRWHKGWLQTWFVHMRRPLALWRDLGPLGFTAFQLIIGGGLLVLALHMAFSAVLVSWGLLALAGIPPTLPSPVAGGLYAAVFLIGYGTAVALVIRAGRRRGLSVSLPQIASLPVYWLLMGIALFAALRELIRRPDHWAKTTHGIARRPSRTAPAIED